MATMSTFKGVANQPHRTLRRLPELTRSVGEAAAALASAEARSQQATRELEARSALVGALAGLDGELRDRRREVGPGIEALRRRRAGMAKKVAALRSVESDARLEDREAWALAVVELGRARLKRAVAELEATLRGFVDGGAASASAA